MSFTGRSERCMIKFLLLLLGFNLDYLSNTLLHLDISLLSCIFMFLPNLVYQMDFTYVEYLLFFSLVIPVTVPVQLLFLSLMIGELFIALQSPVTSCASHLIIPCYDLFQGPCYHSKYLFLCATSIYDEVIITLTQNNLLLLISS